MSSFGERLRDEREARKTTIEEIAVATGIQLSYLEALEKNEFQSLPGRAFGKLYIRAYAEALGFDPEPLIEDYEQEQRLTGRASAEPPSPEPVRPRRVEGVIARWREAKLAERTRPERVITPAEGEPGGPAMIRCDEPSDVRDSEPCGAREGELIEAPPAEPVEAEQDPAAEIVHEAPAEHDEAAALVSVPEASARIPRAAPRSSRPLVVALIFFGLLIGAAGTCITFFRTGTEESGSPSTVTSERETPGKDPSAVESAREPLPAHAAEPPQAPRPTESATGAATEPGDLTVPEFGVGRRIVRRRLEGQADRFAEGAVVWFSTRVLGGRSGEPIRHVWLHEGRAVQSIKLGLGGRDWRTHSSKTLRDAGQWAVEARDEEGRVLARATFTCVPAGPETAHQGTRLRPRSSR